MNDPTVANRRHLGLLLTGRADHRFSSTFSPDDWSGLTETARREGVAPLLYHALECTAWPSGTPDSVRRQLRTDYLKAGGSNLLIYRELARILTAIYRESSKERQPTVVLLKGAALATTLYPELALRPMTDVDLLLPRDAIDRSERAVRSLGYREIGPEMSPGFSREVRFQVALKGGPRGYVIAELHWRLVGGEGDWRSPKLDWFWSQTEPWEMTGESCPSEFPAARQLSPTAHLLYLAAHLMLQHGGASARLLWLYDLHLMMTQCGGRLDWAELCLRASEFRWAAALRAALDRSQDIFDTPIPEGVLDALARDSDLEARALVVSKSDPGRTRATGMWYYLRSLDWPRRRRLLASVLWPTPEYLRWRYRPRPKWLWPFCYPYRWGSFAVDCTRTLAKWARGRQQFTRV